MYLEHLSLTDFRSYAQVDVDLTAGITVLIGPNGTGKTNLVEAIGYLSTLGSHRVSSDQPLLRFETERALVRGRLRRGVQAVSLEVEINSGRANRARINRANPVRAREILGICRTVLFAPEDLALVKGDPAGRRKFLDDLLVTLLPHHGATSADYDRVLKQRNALLKSAKAQHYSRSGVSGTNLATLDVWDQHLAAAGAKLLAARLELVERIRPHLEHAYEQLTDGSKRLAAVYRSSLDDAGMEFPAEADPGIVPVAAKTMGTALAGLTTAELTARYLAALAQSRRRELERGLSLVGPHRDELDLVLGGAPARGYASHGETWSTALSLRLAAYYLMVEDDPAPGAGPILILDDVFAELDADRRSKLARIAAGAEQVLVTAAVAGDIPAELTGSQITMVPGGVGEIVP